MLKFLHYSLREIKNVFEFYLIPFVALILPRQIYFPFFKFICRSTLFFKKYSHDSYNIASELMHIETSEKQWNQHVKLLYLTDIADFWLARFRPKKLLDMTVHHGNWETVAGHLAISAHYGAGYVTLLDLKQCNLAPHFVFAQPQVEFKFQSFVERKYSKIRVKHINSISGTAAIMTGGGYAKILQIVDNRGVPIILFDAPQIGKKSKYCLNIFQHKYKIASGFVKLICQEKIKYQLYNTQLDFKTGEKIISINPLKSTNNEIELLQELSQYFQTLLEKSPEQWFFWRQSRGLFISKTH